MIFYLRSGVPKVFEKRAALHFFELKWAAQSVLHQIRSVFGRKNCFSMTFDVIFSGNLGQNQNNQKKGSHFWHR